MSATKFNYVFRTGGVSGSAVPSFYTCLTALEITDAVDGDIAYQTANQMFVKYNGSDWNTIGGTEDLETRVTLLEILVAVIISQGFGGL